MIPEGGSAPVWDRFGVRWNWDDDIKQFVCEDPDYSGPTAVEVGAIPADRQPTFARPPRPEQQTLAELEHQGLLDVD